MRFEIRQPGKYFTYQHLERSWSREACAVEHEVVDAQVDERPHLFKQLIGCPNEAEVFIIVSAPAAFGKSGSLLLSWRASASTDPGSPYSRWIPADLGAVVLECINHRSVPGQAGRRHIPPVSVLRRQAEHFWLERTDHDRRDWVRTWLAAGPGHPVMLAFKSGRLLAPHPAYDLDGFF